MGDMCNTDEWKVNNIGLFDTDGWKVNNIEIYLNAKWPGGYTTAIEWY